MEILVGKMEQSNREGIVFMCPLTAADRRGNGPPVAKTLPASCTLLVPKRPPFAKIFGLITQV
jgi:hypothetical protein